MQIISLLLLNLLTRTASTPAGVTAEITAAVAAVELNDLADVVITNGTTGDII